MATLNTQNSVSTQEKKGFLQNGFDAIKAVAKATVPLFGLMFRTATDFLKTTGEIIVNGSKSAYKGSKRFSKKTKEQEKEEKNVFGHLGDASAATVKAIVSPLAGFVYRRTLDTTKSSFETAKRISESSYKGYKKIAQAYSNAAVSDKITSFSTHQKPLPDQMAKEIEKSLFADSSQVEKNEVKQLQRLKSQSDENRKGLGF